MTSAQPATAKGRETRERIIRAAARARRRARGRRHLAGRCSRRSHASKSQLYHYFADRDDLLRAVASAASDEVVGGQAELFAQLDTIDGLHAWAEELVTLQQGRNAKGGCPIGSLAGQLAERDEGARLELADGLDRWEAAIREGLERMSARGELRTGDRPGRACAECACGCPGRPVAHPGPARPQPAPLSPERRDRRDRRRARRALILGSGASEVSREGQRMLAPRAPDATPGHSRRSHYAAATRVPGSVRAVERPSPTPGPPTSGWPAGPAAEIRPG